MRPSLARFAVCACLLAACAEAAPLPTPGSLEKEVARFLQLAAAHATHRQACVDGGGEIASVEKVTVVVHRDGSRLRAEVSDTAVVQAVGDQRGCRNDCAKAFPTTRTARRLDLLFRPHDAAHC